MSEGRYPVTYLPKWWPLSRGFTFKFPFCRARIFATPATVARGDFQFALFLAHEGDHCELWELWGAFGFLRRWATKAGRLWIEGRAIAAEYVRHLELRPYLSENGRAAERWRLAEALHEGYWFGGRYTLAECHDTIVSFLAAPEEPTNG